jgi:hypothetical protein
LPGTPLAVPSVDGAVGKVAAAVSTQIELLKALEDSGIKLLLLIVESVTAALL